MQGTCGGRPLAGCSAALGPVPAVRAAPLAPHQGEPWRASPHLKRQGRGGGRPNGRAPHGARRVRRSLHRRGRPAENPRGRRREGLRAGPRRGGRTAIRRGRQGAEPFGSKEPGNLGPHHLPAGVRDRRAGGGVATRRRAPRRGGRRRCRRRGRGRAGRRGHDVGGTALQRKRARSGEEEACPPDAAAWSRRPGDKPPGLRGSRGGKRRRADRGGRERREERGDREEGESHKEPPGPRGGLWRERQEGG